MTIQSPQRLTLHQAPVRPCRSGLDYAVTEFAAGRPIVLLGAQDRQNEGDLLVAAHLITSASMAFLVRYTSGYVRVAITATSADRLGLPPMVSGHQSRRETAECVTVDAALGIATGISAHDRARCARLLADPATQAEDLTRPGHIIPVVAAAGGILARRGTPEAALELTRLAAVPPAAAVAAVVSERNPAAMADRSELIDFAALHNLAVLDLDQLTAHLARPLAAGTRSAAARLSLSAWRRGLRRGLVESRFSI